MNLNEEEKAEQAKRKEEIQLKIKKFLEKVEEESIEINYEGHSIWWFFEDRFLGYRLSSQLFSRKDTVNVKSIPKEREFKLNNEIKNKIKAFFLRKFLLWNEKSKIWISKLNNRESKLEDNKDTVMFLVHSNAILFDKKFDKKSQNPEFKVDRIETLVDEVKKDKRLQEYISVVDPISHNSGLKLLKYENLVYRYVDNEIKKKSKSVSSNLHNKWKNMRNKIFYESKIERELLGYFQTSLDLFFSEEMIYSIIMYYETYKKIIEKKNIELLCIYSPAGVITRCAVAAAKKLNVKCLMVPHGLGFPRNNCWINSIYFAIEAEKIREDLITLGNKSENIFVTGPVFMDKIVKYVKTDERDRGNVNNKKILFLTQTAVEDSQLTADDWARYIKKYLNDLSKMSNTEIIIKPKSREKNVKLYEDIIRKEGYKNIKIKKTQSKNLLYKLIRDSDIVVTFHSTAIVESIIIGTPTLVIDLIFRDLYDPMIKNENIPHLNPDGDISETIQEVLHDEKIRKKVLENEKKVIEKYLYKVDGKAGKRVLGVIKKLIAT